MSISLPAERGTCLAAPDADARVAVRVHVEAVVARPFERHGDVGSVHLEGVLASETGETERSGAALQ
jgi:hypothetical protein